MKNVIAITSLLAAGTVWANAATDLTLEPNTSGGNDLLAVSLWGYFWQLQDTSGATRPDASGGNAWAGVSGQSDTTKDSEGSVYAALTTTGNADYSIKLNSSETISFSLNESLNLYAFDGSAVTSGTSTSYEIDFGSLGSITTNQQLNFGQGASSFSFAVDLTEEQLVALSGGMETVERVLLTGNGNYGIWNFSDENKTRSISCSALEALGYTSAGFVADVDDVKTGQYGLVYTGPNDGPNSVKFIAVSIPEPSAFGLLAGLGALAFVAERRRRNRKA